MVSAICTLPTINVEHTRLGFGNNAQGITQFGKSKGLVENNKDYAIQRDFRHYLT
jgi:hypothetical protein